MSGFCPSNKKPAERLSESQQAPLQRKSLQTSFGNNLTMTDALGQRETYTYETLGQVIQAAKTEQNTQ